MISTKIKNRIDKINFILNQFKMSMTVRQIFYQFVSRNWEKNNIKGYSNIKYALKVGRENKLIDSDMIADTSRPYYQLSVWDSIDDFIDDVKNAFRLNFWQNSQNHVEVWTEKDALSSVIRPITDKFRLRLEVTRGYESLSMIHKAKNRFDTRKNVVIIYVGDHDPSGLDIPRVLDKEFDRYATIEKIALSKEQIEQFKLPSQQIKDEDIRSHGYSRLHGNQCWELDALPPNVLQSVITDAIKKYVDFNLDEILQEEKQLKGKLDDIC